MRLADLNPGDVVEHPSGFRWVLLRMEPMGRCFEWAPLPCPLDMGRVKIKPRWSPPHTEEDWHAEMEAEIRPNG
jgi:hypothetical protein